MYRPVLTCLCPDTICHGRWVRKGRGEEGMGGGGGCGEEGRSI